MEKKALICFAIAALVLSLLAANTGKITGYAVNAVRENEYSEIDFSTYTKAVCENNEKGVYCHDEFFMRCNGTEQQVLSSPVKCRDMEQKVELPNGSTTFSSEWKDPRLQ